MRVKLIFPAHTNFSLRVPVRITDLNYGGHVGNDSILTLLHEARVQYLASLGYTEISLGGAGLIMADVAIQYKAEIHYPALLQVNIATENIGRVNFDIFYQIFILQGDEMIEATIAKTGMVCYNYTEKKVVEIPEEAKMKLNPVING